MSQPIRSESDDLKSGWVLDLMLDITTSYIRRGRLYTSTLCIRNFSGMDPHPDPHPDWGGVDSNHIIGAPGAHLDPLESGPTQGLSRGMYPQYKCTQVQSSLYLFKFTSGPNPLLAYCKHK